MELRERGGERDGVTERDGRRVGRREGEESAPNPKLYFTRIVV